MSEPISDDKLQELLALVGSKRARVVVEHIAKNGYITTEDLERVYGYNHPPRAARDVRDAGVPLRTLRVISSDGRSIAAYAFGDLNDLRKARAGGRKNWSKPFKKALYEQGEGKCHVCSGSFEARYLQIDHRIPYEIAGDDPDCEQHPDDYMLLCGSCNRAKSWSCEHCPNWEKKSAPTCSMCYWASPERYSHIALDEIRRADLQWQKDEVDIYDKLGEEAKKKNVRIPDYIKRLLDQAMKAFLLFLGV